MFRFLENLLFPEKQLCKVFIDLCHLEISSFLLMSAKTIGSLTRAAMDFSVFFFIFIMTAFNSLAQI